MRESSPDSLFLARVCCCCSARFLLAVRGVHARLRLPSAVPSLVRTLSPNHHGLWHPSLHARRVPRAQWVSALSEGRSEAAASGGLTRPSASPPPSVNFLLCLHRVGERRDCANLEVGKPLEQSFCFLWNSLYVQRDGEIRVKRLHVVTCAEYTWARPYSQDSVIRVTAATDSAYQLRSGARHPQLCPCHGSRAPAVPPGGCWEGKRVSPMPITRPLRHVRVSPAAGC